MTYTLEEKTRRRKYYLANRKWLREGANKCNRELRRRERKKALEILGMKCVRCGFSDIRALQIDHINGGGKDERRTLFQYRIIKKLINDPSGYQLLCANCNSIKMFENREMTGRPR